MSAAITDSIAGARGKEAVFIFAGFLIFMTFGEDIFGSQSAHSIKHNKKQYAEDCVNVAPKDRNIPFCSSVDANGKKLRGGEVAKRAKALEAEAAKYNVVSPSSKTSANNPSNLLGL